MYKNYLEDLTSEQKLSLAKAFTEEAVNSMENNQGSRAAYYIRAANSIMNRSGIKSMEWLDYDMLSGIVYTEEKL